MSVRQELIQKDLFNLKRLKEELQLQFSNLQYLRKDNSDHQQTLLGSHLNKAINQNIMLTYSIEMQLMNYDSYVSSDQEISIPDENYGLQLDSLMNLSTLFYDKYKSYQKELENLVSAKEPVAA